MFQNIVLEWLAIGGTCAGPLAGPNLVRVRISNVRSAYHADSLLRMMRRVGSGTEHGIVIVAPLNEIGRFISAVTGSALKIATPGPRRLQHDVILGMRESGSAIIGFDKCNKVQPGFGVFAGRANQVCIPLVVHQTVDFLSVRGVSGANPLVITTVLVRTVIRRGKY